MDSGSSNDLFIMVELLLARRVLKTLGTQPNVISSELLLKTPFEALKRLMKLHKTSAGAKHL